MANKLSNWTDIVSRYKDKQIIVSYKEELTYSKHIYEYAGTLEEVTAEGDLLLTDVKELVGSEVLESIILPRADIVCIRKKSQN